MKFEIKESKLNGDQLKLIIELESSIEKLEGQLSFHRGYDNSVMDRILLNIVDRISDHYIQEKRTEILDAMNLDRIVKGCELKAIEKR